MALDDIPTDGERRRHSDLRAAIDRIAEQAATIAGREAGRRAGRSAAIAFFCLITVLLVGATVWSRLQEDKLRDGLVASCNRVNRLRVQESNRNAQVMYAALYNARERERKLAVTDHAGAATHRKAVAYLDVSIDALRWTPMSDCAGAVDDARNYAAPTPEPFTARYLDLRIVPK